MSELLCKHMQLARSCEICDLERENAELREQVDKLLDHCPDSECPHCARIICPHNDSFHFHHDGCPSCAEHDEANARAALKAKP